MRCIACHGPAVFERTVFQGTAPTTVRLCAPCVTRVDVTSRLQAIQSAPDHNAKTAAVDAFLAAVNATNSENPAPGV